MGIIYKATNTKNNKSYIGQTIKKLDDRKRSHINRAKSGSEYYFHRSIRRYGEEFFTWEILEECEDDILDEREIFYIGFYNTLSKNKYGYNMTSGGNTIFGCSGEDHWLKRMTDDEKKEWIDKNRIGKNNPNFRNGDSIRGEKHYSKKMDKKQLKEVLDKISGENNYQKKISTEERKSRHWINNKTKEEIEVFKNNCKLAYQKRKNDENVIQNLKNAALKRRGKQYNTKKYVVTFPDGSKYIVVCFKNFRDKSKELYGIDLTKLIRCINGHIESYKGFVLHRFNEDMDNNLTMWTEEVKNKLFII